MQQAKVYPIQFDGSGNPKPVTLTPPSSFGFTVWEAVVITNYSASIAAVFGASDDLNDIPAIPPFTSDLFRYTNARGAITVQWLQTGILTASPSIIATFVQYPGDELRGKFYPAAVPTAPQVTQTNPISLIQQVSTTADNVAASYTQTLNGVSTNSAIAVHVYQAASGSTISVAAPGYTANQISVQTGPASQQVQVWSLTGGAGGTVVVTVTSNSNARMGGNTIELGNAASATFTANTPNSGASSTTSFGPATVSTAGSMVFWFAYIPGVVNTAPGGMWSDATGATNLGNSIGPYSFQQTGTSTLADSWTNNSALDSWDVVGFVVSP